MTGVHLRIEVIAPNDVDRGLCQIGHLSLERDGNGTFLGLANADVDRARAILGRCGIATHPSARPAPAVGTVPGAVRDLVPLRVSGIADHIAFRAVDLADATRLVRRGVLRRYDAERLRPLLHGDDCAYAWRRVIWMPRAVVRARELRHVRPIVFDRAAINDGVERWGFALAGSLARWMAG